MTDDTEAGLKVAIKEFREATEAKRRFLRGAAVIHRKRVKSMEAEIKMLRTKIERLEGTKA